MDFDFRHPRVFETRRIHIGFFINAPERPPIFNNWILRAVPGIFLSEFHFNLPILLIRRSDFNFYARPKSHRSQFHGPSDLPSRRTRSYQL